MPRSVSRYSSRSGTKNRIGLAGDGEVEHHRGVVGDADIRGQVEVGDLWIGGDVENPLAG